MNANDTWGRNNKQSWITTVSAITMIACLPGIVMWFWITLTYFDGSFTQTSAAWRTEGPASFIIHYMPRASSEARNLFIAWLSFQACLYTILPGGGTGQLTPAGNLLKYNINGFLAWQLTIGLAVLAVIWGFFDPTIIADHWEGLLVSANAYGYLLSALAYAKAYFWPSHAEDRKFSGIAVYDFCMGIELNPRFGSSWNWKLFHNGRPGIIGWTLIDLSFTAVQYRRFGHITNSMIVVDILHTLYVVDFFINEDWYIRTIDIAHDHFGFYLAWGSAIWLPAIYTLQVQYLARHPVRLSTTNAFLILGIGIGSYIIFRMVNHQKNLARRNNGNCNIWGRKARYIRAPFITGDGSKHDSILLVSGTITSPVFPIFISELIAIPLFLSAIYATIRLNSLIWTERPAKTRTGWWGITRHANYTCDLILAFCMCAPCGTKHILPWFYGFYMTTLLIHRCYRDEKRCSAKYGTAWEEYTKQVPYRLIPGIF